MIKLRLRRLKVVITIYMFLISAILCPHAVRALAMPNTALCTQPSSILSVQSVKLPHMPHPQACLSNGLRRLLVTMRGGAARLASVLLFSYVLSTNQAIPADISIDHDLADRAAVSPPLPLPLPLLHLCVPLHLSALPSLSLLF